MLNLYSSREILSVLIFFNATKDNIKKWKQQCNVCIQSPDVRITY